MAVSTRISARPFGRPKTAAVIELDDDDEIEQRNIFFRVCKSLSYSDRIHLANGLNVTFRTVQNWHYGDYYPDPAIAKAIVKWYDNGKPVTVVEPCDMVRSLI